MLLRGALQPQIFNTLGLTQTGSLLGTLVVSAVNILATVVAILAVDRCTPSMPLWSCKPSLFMCDIIIRTHIAHYQCMAEQQDSKLVCQLRFAGMQATSMQSASTC